MTMDKALRNYPEWISKPKREKGENVCEKLLDWIRRKGDGMPARDFQRWNEARMMDALPGPCQVEIT